MASTSSQIALECLPNLGALPFFLTDNAFTKIKVIKAGQIGVTGLFVIPYNEEVMGRVYKLMEDLAKAEEYMQLAAEIYMDMDKIGAAEEVLNEILGSGTDSLNVFNNLGVLYRKKGQPQIALKQYKKALKVHPDEPYIYYNIGRLYLDLKNTEQAKQFFQSALEKDEEFEEAKQVLKAIDFGII